MISAEIQMSVYLLDIDKILVCDSLKTTSNYINKRARNK